MPKAEVKPRKNILGKSVAEDRAAHKRIQNPVSFVEYYLRHKTWSLQREVLHAIDKYSRVAIKACHASSKTFTAAELVLWWITKHKHNAVVLTTSPTGRQVETLLWGEIRKTLASDTILIDYPESNLATLKLAEDRWATGFSTGAEGAGVNIAGFHGDQVLVIIDESTGVEGAIWEALEGARAGGNVKQLVLCNPIVPSGTTYEIFTRDRAQWKCFTISAFDTPNFKCQCEGIKHPDFTLEMLRELPPGLGELDHPAFLHIPWPSLVKPYWVYEAFTKYGEDSAFFQSRVLGLFPTQGEDSLYSLAKLEAAKGNAVDLPDEPVIVGIDVAGPGKDETTVCVRVGDSVVAHKAWTERDAEKAQGAVVGFLAPWKKRARCANVDITGIGHYFPTALRADGWVVRGVNFGAAPENKATPDNPKAWAVQCANRKAEIYWQTRDILHAGKIHGLDDEMISQAAQVLYFYDLQGRVAIEPKKAAAKRGVHSPDRWESVVLAFGVDAYESLAKSLAFTKQAKDQMNREIGPRDARDDDLKREAEFDIGMRHTRSGINRQLGRGAW